MKAIKWIWIFLIVGFGSPSAFCQDLTLPAIILQLPAYPADLGVGIVERHQEEQALSQALRTQGQLLVVHNGTGDPIYAWIQSQPEDIKQRIDTLDASQVDLSQAQFGEHQEQIQNRLQSLQSLRTSAQGLMISAGAAGIFSAPVYLTAGLETATQMYGAALLFYAFQMTLPRMWQNFLDLGGQATIAFHKMYKQLFHQPLGRSAPGWIRNLGRLASAFGFSFATTTTFLELGTAEAGLFSTMFLAALGTYDLAWELVVTRLRDLGVISENSLRRFSRFRLASGALLDSLVLGVAGLGLTLGGVDLNTAAQITMGVVTVSGLVALFRPEVAEQGLNQSRRAGQLWDRLKSRLQSFLPSVRRCRELLPVH